MTMGDLFFLALIGVLLLLSLAFIAGCERLREG
jgi:hypothetical protein